VIRVLSDEVAQEQLDALIEFYEFELESLPESMQSTMPAILRQIKSAIASGRLEVAVTADDCKITQNLKRPPPGFPGPIVYGQVSGRSKTSIRQEAPTYQKNYAFLAGLSGENILVFEKLTGKDLSVAEALASFFIQI
jgi:hypothetical protein